MPVEDARIKALFERYERFFNRSLAGEVDTGALASLYAPAFIAATPAGVMTGRNDDGFRAAMVAGYAHYRAIGTKQMRIRDIRISPIDEHHCLAHMAWRAVYAKQDRPDAVIEFDVHYFVQALEGEPKVFGWASGDEEAVLRAHGIA